jgi:hypothetical protein
MVSQHQKLYNYGLQQDELMKMKTVELEKRKVYLNAMMEQSI